jgi:Kef-type K+ transport system membrane component KefB
MDGAWLARARWRQRGAWLWPTFVMLAIVDGLIVHALPMAGETQTPVGGVVFALVLNVIAVLLLSRPLGRLLRRRRTDMPVGVARNYGGTFAVLLVSVGMLAIGLLHHPAIVADRHALNDAIVRAEAYIGDRAPPEFRVNAMHTNTYTIQPRTVFRTCVPNRAGTRTYCVVVRPTSIAFGGYEPNSVMAEGTN